MDPCSFLKKDREAKVPSKKAKAAAAGAVGLAAGEAGEATAHEMTNRNASPRLDVREPARVLGTILSSLEMFDREHLLAVAAPILKLAERRLSVETYPEEKLRQLLCDTARGLYTRRPGSLKAVDDIIASTELATLEKE